MAVVVAAPLLLLSLLIVATVIILVTRKARQVHSRLPLPPSPPGVPLIGHLHLLGFMPHVGLRNLAMKYGDFMVVRLGAVPTLVISSPRAAMEILRTQDSFFASRPTSMAATALLGGPVDVAFTAYGDEWRRAKKILTTTSLTVNKVGSFRRGRESEMARAMARISDAAAGHEALDMGKLLRSLSMAMVCRAVFRPAFNMDGRCQQLQDLVRSTGALVAGYSVGDMS